MRLFTPLAALVVLATPILGSDFSSTCANYYLGNGVSDSTGELFVEAWCDGGEDEYGNRRQSSCSRLNLLDCYKNVNGDLLAFDTTEERNRDLINTCDIDSCAMRGDPWDGPIMSCYCRSVDGQWKLSEVNLDDHLGNYRGTLLCGVVLASDQCMYPWTPDDDTEAELR